MTIASLWLPIVLSAVIVFVASSAIHMMLKYHQKDVRQLPNEGDVMDLVRKGNLTPGVYVYPYHATMKDMSSPAGVEKFTRGPVGLLTALPNGTPKMGKLLTQWFVFSLAVGVVVAYVTGRTTAAGTAYLAVFRVAGVTAFLGYTGSEAVRSIWGGQPWGNTVRNYIDGFIYALLTAGVFGWLWPR